MLKNHEKKSCIVIFEETLPIQVCEIRQYDKVEDILKLSKECEKNKLALLKKEQDKNKALEEYLAMLEKRLRLVEAELKFNRGEITEKEFNEICEQQQQ